MPFTDEEIKELERERRFLFSAKALNAVLASAQKMSREDFMEAVREKQIPVLESARELEILVKRSRDYLLVPYFLHKDNPEDLLLSTSSMHMNWLWPNLLYVPMNIRSEDGAAIRSIYELALKNERAIFINHTIPHKSNPVMREMFGGGSGEGDYLIRDKETFRIAEGNGRAFVEMASNLLESKDFTGVTVVIVGVGGAGTLAARAIHKEGVRRLILVDLFDRSALAKELGAEFYQGTDLLPEVKAKRLVTIDASSHFERGIERPPALDFVEKHDAEENVFIDYNINTPVGAYDKLATRCGVGSEYLAFTNYILAQEIREAAAAIGVRLPFVSREDFDSAVAESISIRDRIKERLMKP